MFRNLGKQLPSKSFAASTRVLKVWQVSRTQSRSMVESLDVEARLQRMHTLSYNLCAILEKKPDSFRKRLNVAHENFGSRRRSRENTKVLPGAMNDTTGTEPSGQMLSIADLKKAYELYYSELTLLMCEKHVLRALFDSIRWKQNTYNMDGVPMHIYQTSMDAAHLHMVSPADLQKGSTHSHTLESNKNSNTGQAEIHDTQASLCLKYCRSLRERKTLRQILYILEHEWRLEAGNRTISLYDCLSSFQN